MNRTVGFPAGVVGVVQLLAGVVGFSGVAVVGAMAAKHRKYQSLAPKHHQSS